MLETIFDLPVTYIWGIATPYMLTDTSDMFLVNRIGLTSKSPVERLQSLVI